jgi:hypothetical protein
MVVMIAQTDIPTFPAAEIEQQIRKLLADEAQVQATLRGTGGGGGSTSSGGASRAEPDLDSLVAVEALLVIEPFVPFDLPESLIRPGGYTSVDHFINDLLPKVHNQWQRHHEGKKQ